MRFLPFSPLLLLLILSLPPRATVGSPLYNGSNDATLSPTHAQPANISTFEDNLTINNYRFRAIGNNDVKILPPSDTVGSSLYNGSYDAILSTIHAQPANISTFEDNLSNHDYRFRAIGNSDLKILPPSDTVGSSIYNGSNDATPSPTHAQQANISTFEDNLPNNNYPIRAIRSSEVKPVASTNWDHGYDSPANDDPLAKAQKEFEDLEKEVNKTSEALANKQIEATEADRKFNEAKKEWEKQEGLLKDWNAAQKAISEWEAANETATKAENALTAVTERLRIANKSLADHQDKLISVKGEPKRLEQANEELRTLTTTVQTLEGEIKQLKEDIPKMKNDETKEQGKYNAQILTVESAGCTGKAPVGACQTPLNTLESMKNKLDTASSKLQIAQSTLKKDEKLHANCTTKKDKLNSEIEDLNISVPNNLRNIQRAKEDVGDREAKQLIVQGEYDKSKKSRDGEFEKMEKKREIMEARKSTSTLEEIKAAEKAEIDFERARDTKEIVDKEVAKLTEDLKSFTSKRDAAKSKYEAQNKPKDQPSLGASEWAGIGVACALLVLIALGIGGFCLWRRRKNKKKGDKQATSVTKATPKAGDASKSSTKTKDTPESKSDQSQVRIGSSQEANDDKAKAKSIKSKEKPQSKKKSNSKEPPNSKEKPPSKEKKRSKEKPESKEKKKSKSTSKEGSSERKYPEIAPLKPIRKIGAKFTFIEGNRRPTVIREATDEERMATVAVLPDGNPSKEAMVVVYGAGMERDTPSARALKSRQDAPEDADTVAGTPSQEDEPGDLLVTEASSGTHAASSRDTVWEWVKRVCLRLDGRLDPKFTKYSDTISFILAASEVVKKGFRGAELSQLVECPLPCLWIGDTHGSLHDMVLHIWTQTEIAMRGRDFPDNEMVLGLFPMVFTGDYVDRGGQQLETITLALGLKILFPDLVVLLRGNHETKAVNGKGNDHPFIEELIDRFGRENGIHLHNLFNELFNYLPLACIVGDKIFTVHGCISPRLKSRDDFRKIDMPLKNPSRDPIANDLLWADPIRGIRGHCPNYVRTTALYVSEEAIKRAHALLDVNNTVRGHQVMSVGIMEFGDNALVRSVFSCSNVRNGNLSGSTFLSANNEWEYHIRIIHDERVTAESAGQILEGNQAPDRDGAKYNKEDLAQFFRKMEEQKKKAKEARDRAAAAAGH